MPPEVPLRKLLLLALASCAASPSPTALPQQAPPGVIVATPAVSGQPLTLRRW